MPIPETDREFLLPGDWLKILDNSVVMVTGVGKSGTTVAALLLASMKPTYHIYEPAMLKIIFPHMTDASLEMVRMIFLYDYCIPITRGMRICDYEFQAVNSEWQWATQQSVRSQRRGDPAFDGAAIFRYLLRERPLFIVNMLDGLVRVDQWRKLFPGMHLIHIVRNGFDTIASAMRRDWHANHTYDHPMHCTVDWTTRDDEGMNMPWYVEEEARFLWKDWTAETRAAHIWRVQVELHPMTVSFERLTEDPVFVASRFMSMFPMLEETELTYMWIRRLQMKTPLIPPHELTLNDIQEPERNKFKETMERLGYL